MSYDSTNDTLIHLKNINAVFDLLISLLERRKELHDRSKLVSPEKESYDKYIPLLKKYKYGSEEYFKVKDEMYKSGTNHHFKNNSHHPEYYPNGMNGFDLLDLNELFVDHLAASFVSDVDFSHGLEINSKKYKMDPMVYHILKNTYERHFKELEKELRTYKKEDDDKEE